MREILGNIVFFNDNLIEGDNLNEKNVYDGKSIYEVIRVIKGVPLFLGLHLNRIRNSGKISGDDIWLNDDEIKHAIKLLIINNKIDEGNIKIVFTYKGKDGKNFYSFFINHHYPTQNEYKNGVATIFYHGERNNPNAKVINQSFRDKVNEMIEKRKVYEAILVDRNGNITEGSKSNIFLVKGDKVYTSPKEDVLPGITREMICKLCSDNNIILVEKRIKFTEIKSYDGLFISGTSPKVLPICKIEEDYFGSNSNLLIKRISKLYDENIQNYILSKELSN